MSVVWSVASGCLFGSLFASWIWTTWGDKQVISLKESYDEHMDELEDRLEVAIRCKDRAIAICRQMHHEARKDDPDGICKEWVTYWPWIDTKEINSEESA